MLITIWTGPAEFTGEYTLQAPGARFILNDVTPDDALIVSEAGTDTPMQILRVLTDDTIDLATNTDFAPVVGTSYTITVNRVINQACPTCERMGSVRELLVPDANGQYRPTHKHCEWSRIVLPVDHPSRNSSEALALARKALIETGEFTHTFNLRGKRNLTMHSTTFGENDLMREWEDDLLKRNPDIPESLYFESESRAHLALALDDDDGFSPSKLLTDNDQELRAPQRMQKMMTFFKKLPDAYYRVQLECLSRLDSLIAEVCNEDPIEDTTEVELLELAEDLVYGNAVESEVKVFGGEGFVIFRNATTEDIDAADAWAQRAIDLARKQNDGTILKVRESELRACAKLAMEFVGDHRQRFSTDADAFTDRVAYLYGLVLPQFHLYTRAGNVWRKRCLKACSTETLGNS